ncbi:uncharacterized protein ASPGLDRAFT_35958 [Aspergillus glaucus CBS 516.65]|uniref:Uncharacterized protein n=1 Tax=Aspergillus glaucus CBS 516.65 TaxID=1160497 RepID=A0A1L9VJ90_ASPGL|nr:hypothetical protein ASPGLDRAFT_35958 [Aspergillus glaucus CBS 516.65]OJJ83952.1 hypothetical protein ASPGLDRAFT_35958 [Aspergillus glaucus CBS 516.65]
MPLTATYKQTPSTKITADIYLPSPSTSPCPVLINIHGGAFMLGDSRMISIPQVDDCLSRDWIVVVPNHRLCPQVNIRDGPLRDVRDCLEWVYADDGLDRFLRESEEGKGYSVDKERVMAFGTSSGGMLACGLGYDVSRPPRAILNFYGAVHFTHPCWTQPIPGIQSKLPPSLTPSFLEQVYTQTPIPTSSNVSLEGQTETGQSAGPDFSRPRDAFAFTQIANGTVIQACCPDPEVRRKIDPVLNVKKGFPPTFVVHGLEDKMVSIEVSRELVRVLKEAGVECGMVEVPGEGHTFAMAMKVGGRTWGMQMEGFEFLERVIS